jgi:uncharacterized protein YdaT
MPPFFAHDALFIQRRTSAVKLGNALLHDGVREKKNIFRFPL